MGYIHRDVKPDNILIDSQGHIRLADFGSCIKVANVKSDGLCTIAVGTPDYISPEILKAMEGSRHSGLLYSFEVDWWSLGVVIFEALYGETPFYAESLIETYSKIMNHKHSFKFPVNAKVTDEAKDLMSNLICDQNSRLKVLDQFKSHSWFTGIDWDSLRFTQPPYQPQVSGPDDTSNFDIDELRPPNNNASNAIGPTGGTKESLLNIHLPFVGFTCTFSAKNAKKGKTDSNHVILSDENNVTVIEQRDDPVKSIEDVVQLTCETVSNGLIEKLESDLRVARQEWSEMTAKLGEMRKEKSSLSLRLRSKEEEIEQQLEKNNELRQQLRCSERIKRQQLDELIQIQVDLDKEKQLRKEGMNCISNNFFR